MKKLLLLALCALLSIHAAEARTLYVNASRPNNKGNGLSAKKAKKTIQAAINIAKKGDTILVYPGAYAPIKTKNKKIAIKSVKGKAKTSLVQNKGSGAVALLGKTWSWTYVATEGPNKGQTVKANSAPYSEGMSTSLEGFVINGGFLGEGEASLGVSGGTVKSSTIKCVGASDEETTPGAAASHASLTCCLITDNYYYGSGRGVVDDCTLKRCTVKGNVGDGCSNIASLSTLVNTLVVENALDDEAFSCCTLLNCTVAANETACSWSLPKFANTTKFYNCILRDNTRQTKEWCEAYVDENDEWVDGHYVYGEAEIHNVDGESAGNTYKNTNKTNKNPKFTAAYKLKKGSYCINKGKLTKAQKKLVGTKDLAGKKRIRGKAIDRGCYEY